MILCPNHKSMPILAAADHTDYLRRQILTSMPRPNVRRSQSPAGSDPRPSLSRPPTGRSDALQAAAWHGANPTSPALPSGYGLASTADLVDVSTVNTGGPLCAGYIGRLAGVRWRTLGIDDPAFPRFAAAGGEIRG